MPFQTADVQCAIDPGGIYVLTEPLVYSGRVDVFVVPAGFRTDLASVPRVFTWMVPVAGIHDRAAIVHDYLCVSLRKVWAGEQDRAYLTGVSARDADGIFRRILRELGVPLLRRWLFYVGVRWGALANPARRRGWWRDAAPVLGITVLVLLAAAAALWTVGAFSVLLFVAVTL